MRRLPLRSPPRMRGKGIADDEARAAVGITPACAGKSELPRFFLRCPWDHPRVCGEKMVSMIPHRRSRGSPPRVRGKAKKRCRSCPLTRITPAYAGKRPAASAARSAKWDHPRVCGEKLHSLPKKRRLLGSPPRMRGKGFGLLVAPQLPGITPAYAGKSCSSSVSSSQRMSWTIRSRI